MRGKKSRKASKEKTGKRTGENEPLNIYANTDRGETINIKTEGINKVGKILEVEIYLVKASWFYGLI